MKQLLYFFSGILLLSCNTNQNRVSTAPVPTPPPTLAQFKLTSPAFKQGGNIPAICTCDSSNTSPELHWNKMPGKIASYALIMNDPDAPMGTWVHWVVFNIPASDTMIPAKFSKDSVMSNGAKQGVTSFHAIGYSGPCPPNGSHRYIFKLFALDTILGLPSTSTGEIRLTNAMKGHILSETELMGRYQRIASH